MQVHAIIYNPHSFSEDLYQRAILLVDPDSAARIKRFYHREDACRTLIGRLLPRMMLKNREISLTSMKFGTTEAGKPYIAAPEIHPPVAFNVSHDNALVVMAFTEGIHGPPAFKLGIDVMRVHLPRRQTLKDFVEVMSEQMTPLEYRDLFKLGVSAEETLSRFFWLWTMKEAFTKALGIGLGFDFRRVEYDIDSGILRVDNVILRGWRLTRFVLNDHEDVYQGVIAEFVGGEGMEIIYEASSPEWLIIKDASAFVENAITQLRALPFLITKVD